MSQKPCLQVSHRTGRKREDDVLDVVTFDDIQQMDATSYLSRVIEEASRLPAVFESSSSTRPEEHIAANKRPRAANYDDCSAAPTVGSAASARYLVSHRTAILPPPTPRHVPAAGLQWVERTLANFSRLRAYLDECQALGVGGRDQPQCNYSRAPVPAMKDQSGWHVFCVGQDDASGNLGGYFQDSSEDDKETEKDNETVPWKYNLPVAGYTPTVSLLLQMDQVMVRRVLGHLTHYVANGDFPVTRQRAAWIYALLARLERPIHRDDAVTLYSLLKRMTALREQSSIATDSHVPNASTEESLSPERNSLSTLNVLIAIVGVYFEQGGGYANVMEVKDA